MSPDATERLTVAEAALRLGVSQDAVRKRIKRGSIRYNRGEGGRVYVYLDASATEQDADPGRGQDRYVRSLEDQVQFLRRELERKDAILLRMAERIPELEAPAEPPQAPTAGDEGAARGDVRPEPQTASRPWWRRIFGE